MWSVAHLAGRGTHMAHGGRENSEARSRMRVYIYRLDSAHHAIPNRSAGKILQIGGSLTSGNLGKTLVSLFASMGFRRWSRNALDT
jgi:hypothetical protein